MRKTIGILLIGILGISTLVLAQQIETITLKAYVIGPGPMGIKKATNLELAAKYLNQILTAAGSNVRVEVEAEFSELKWGPFADKFYLDFAAGKAPDIVTMRETGELAAEGFIVPMDEHVKEFWDLNYFDFYANLWGGATYEGKIWGIPHDIAPAGVWYRKDVLRELGYTDDEIATLLPNDGNTTLETLARLAKEAVDAGLVEYGILHRPKKGSNTYARLLEFGIDCYNPETGNLELDKTKLLAFFQWHKNMVDEGVIPPEPPAWSTIHGTFVEGKTFATLASHVGTPAEWQAKYGPGQPRGHPGGVAGQVRPDGRGAGERPWVPALPAHRGGQGSGRQGRVRVRHPPLLCYLAVSAPRVGQAPHHVRYLP